MRLAILILLTALVVSCGTANAPPNVNSGDGNITSNSDLANSGLEKSAAKKLTPKCGGKTYSILIADKGGNQSIVLAEGDNIRRIVKMPTQADAANFSLDHFGETKNGFEIAVEYGSKYYYRKSFNFVCENGEFYFDKVGIERFEKDDPSKITKKDVKTNPKEPLERFSFTGFLID